jgi:DNA-binding beta-propeller fold protein YncE/plastocyanin
MKWLIALLFALLVIAGCSAIPVGHPKNEIHITDIPPWYNPLVLEVEPGTKVVWDNGMAAVVHPVNILSGPEKFSSGHFIQKFEHTFDKPGVYHYFCPIHPYMQGFVSVGEKVPAEKLPLWFDWPPATAEQPVPGPMPEVPGIGEVWLDAQFQKIIGKPKPGAIIVVDAETWQVKQTITDSRLNNPHNMWLSDDGNYVMQTNWFDNYLSIIDRNNKSITKHVYVGESNAHVMTANGFAYVTIQGADGIAIINGTTFAKKRTFRTIGGEHGHGENEDGERELGRGPHGNWISDDGKRMAVAYTEGGGIGVWDLVDTKEIFEAETDPLPLFAGISKDGRYAWAASLITGKFQAFDIDAGKEIASFVAGKGPVQNVPSPDGKYILTALSGDGAVAVIDAQKFELIKSLPSGAGAHGVIYGPKKNGGTYAYVSNKFVPWITVIDMASLEIAGYIPLSKESLGGQGILAIPGVMQG